MKEDYTSVCTRKLNGYTQQMQILWGLHSQNKIELQEYVRKEKEILKETE